jgi:hypothetical protein
MVFKLQFALGVAAYAALVTAVVTPIITAAVCTYASTCVVRALRDLPSLCGGLFLCKGDA